MNKTLALTIGVLSGLLVGVSIIVLRAFIITYMFNLSLVDKFHIDKLHLADGLVFLMILAVINSKPDPVDSKDSKENIKKIVLSYYLYPSLYLGAAVLAYRYL